MAVEKKLLTHLQVILGADVTPDITSYLSRAKTVADVDEFMENILDKSNKAHVSAYEAIKNILFGGNKTQNKSGNNVAKPNKVSTNSQGSFNNSLSQNSSNGASQKGGFPKGKKKFQDINTFKEKKKQKQGREICDCEGQEHDFMNNCLFCGRIHCVEEGPGPCFFCGNTINTLEEDQFNVNNRKQKQGSSGTFKHKENKVFDDDNDYFKVNSKEVVKKHKQNRVIALDFATRRVIESSEEDEKIKAKLLKNAMNHVNNVEKMFKNLQISSEVHNNIVDPQDDLVDLLIQMRHKKPVGHEDLGDSDSKEMPIIHYGTKVIDEEFLVNTDHGLCLSMHQPYASLLVAGVKMHEGRTWPTNHRGRLWVAAASKVPDDDEISALESFYRDYYQDTTLKFPKTYPTSCLLGCVFVEDCLDQETYRQKFPNGESNSPFVLICTNPIILPVFYPIVGQHKIYPLDKDLHKIAKMSLRYAKYIS